MKSYVLSEVKIVDPAQADEYRQLAAASIAAYGGEYVVRAGEREVLEGEWPSDQVVILVAFPNKETAQHWYHSPEYAKALKIRQTALERRLILLEGVGNE